MWGAPPTPPSTLPLRPRGLVAPRKSGGARAAPAPPHPHPLPQGARGPDGAPSGLRVGAWGRSPHRGRAPALGAPSEDPLRGGCRTPSPPPSPSGGRGGRRGRARPPIRAGAWGRSPHRKKIRGRVGGPEPRAAQARPGWGCGGKAPRRREGPHPCPLPQGEGAGGASGVGGALEGLSAGERRTPSPPPSPARGEGAGSSGGVGAQPPHRRKSEGGWVGQSGAQRRLVRDGAWGRSPHRGQALAL